MITTRPAATADLNWLAATFLTAMRDVITAARGGWEQAREREQFFDQLSLRDTQILVSDGVDVGFVMLAPHGADLELHTLCLTPEAQRRGLGTQAVHDVLRTAQSRQQGIVLSVLKVNTRARSFFERAGFVPVGASADHIRLARRRLAA